MSPTVRDLATDIPPGDSLAVRFGRDFGSFARASLWGLAKKWKARVTAELAETSFAWWSSKSGCASDAVVDLVLIPFGSPAETCPLKVRGLRKAVCSQLQRQPVAGLVDSACHAASLHPAGQFEVGRFSLEATPFAARVHFQGSENFGSVRNVSSVSDMRKAITSARSSADSSKPVISLLFCGLSRPSPA